MRVAGNPGNGAVEAQVEAQVDAQVDARRLSPGAFLESAVERVRDADP
jgi:hypothetical protein